jgi:DNA-directed RNA polymerase subunit RPC12/RpoP
VPLDDTTRERVVLLGGKVSGVECQDCGTRNRDVDLSPNQVQDVHCPDCGAKILTEGQVAALRHAGKL